MIYLLYFYIYYLYIISASWKYLVSVFSTLALYIISE